MAIDVQADSLHRLLELQAEDTAIKRLEERRAALPEAARLAEINDRLAELSSDLEIAQKQSSEIAREQDKIEGEIGILEEKIGREEQRLFSGAVANPKELSGLQAEVEMLKRQKAGKEDALLEIMVQKDDATATLERLTAEHDATSKESSELGQTVAGLTGDIDAELATHRAARDAKSNEVPDDLRALYEKIRESKGGVGAAALKAGTCEGCHTSLPSREVERMKKEGGLQRCENCRRILVV
jgi:predicted  nucleic acid-binding Zn-ribbon protein